MTIDVPKGGPMTIEVSCPTTPWFASSTGSVIYSQAIPSRRVWQRHHDGMTQQFVAMDVPEGLRPYED